VQDNNEKRRLRYFRESLREESEQQMFGTDSKGDRGHFPRKKFMFRRGLDLLLKTCYTVWICIGHITTSLVMEIEAQCGHGFQSYKSEGTTASCGHTYRGVDFRNVVQLYGFGMIF
jgi:hypothetical protein